MTQDLHHALGVFHSNFGNLLGAINGMETDELSMLAVAFNSSPGEVRERMATALSQAGSGEDNANVDPTDTRPGTVLEKARQELILTAIDCKSAESLKVARDVLFGRAKAVTA